MSYKLPVIDISLFTTFFVNSTQLGPNDTGNKLPKPSLIICCVLPVKASLFIIFNNDLNVLAT